MKKTSFLRTTLSDLDVYKFAEKKVINQHSFSPATSDSLEKFKNMSVLEPRREFVTTKTTPNQTKEDVPPNCPSQVLTFKTRKYFNVPKLIVVQETDNSLK